jgi:DUF1680 family protein
MTPPNPARRRFLSGSTLLAAGLVAGKVRGDGSATDQPATPAPGLTDTSASPHAVVRSVGLNEVRWTRGFWADKFATCCETMVPRMGTLMVGTEPSQFLQNLRIAAGEVQGKHRGPPWNDGDFYKWLEAAAAAFAVSHDATLDRRMDAVIGVIARAQSADGYVHTPVLIRKRNGDQNARPFQDRLDFETYNLGHLITAACVHHRATGKSSLLRVAEKSAEFLAEAVRIRGAELARNGVCPSHFMAVVELYRTTREPKHLALARALVEERAIVDGGTDDNQDRIPFRKQTTAAGHAARANYLYAGVADLVAETGDRSLFEPLMKIADDVVSRKMYVTGACGALYDGASPDGVSDQKAIARVHQAYGRAYQLPNSAAHNETCAAVGNVLWNWRMLALTGAAHYADVLELALYNAVLAGISLDGTRFFYVNTLCQLDTMPAEFRWSRTRQPFISCFCCPPNVVRAIAESASYAYGRSASAVWVHLYGGSVLDTEVAAGARLRLAQKTDYPWDGRVTITIEAAPATACSLRLRIPGWADGAALNVNGKATERPPEPGTYADVHRVWSPGDVVELVLPMRPRLLQAHPLVEEARNQAAVQRGPIVYCLESCDLPDGVRVPDVVLPRGIALEPRFDPTLLGGVTVLEGRALARIEKGWSKELYREISHVPARPIDLRLIPYYAWGNRGHSEMTVWMPLGA